MKKGHEKDTDKYTCRREISGMIRIENVDLETGTTGDGKEAENVQE